MDPNTVPVEAWVAGGRGIAPATQAPGQGSSTGVPVPQVLGVRLVREVLEPAVMKPRPNIDATKLTRHHWPPSGPILRREDGTQEVAPVVATREVPTPPYSVVQLQVLATLGRYVVGRKPETRNHKHKKLLEKIENAKTWLKDKAAADVRDGEQENSRPRLVLVPTTRKFLVFVMVWTFLKKRSSQRSRQRNSSVANHASH
jgi:hypothetical protein